MASVKERATDGFARARERWPVLDHVVRMQQHYSGRDGNQQAGAVTYFAFLSFFPIMALAFFVVGYVARVYPDAQQGLIDAVDAVLPGLVGTGEGQVSVSTIEDAASTVGLIGVFGLLYSGLNWMSALRDGLGEVFEQPEQAEASFVAGKLRDLLSLLTLGVVLISSVALAGLVTGFSDVVLGWLGLDQTLDWAVTLVGRAISFAAVVVLFYAFFRLPANVDLPSRSLWSGALLGGIAFEALKALSFLLLGSTQGSPAFQAFGIALILLVWMNYFSRVVLYAAAWAWTSPEARELREQRELEEARMLDLARVDLHESPTLDPDAAPGRRRRTARAFAAGGATAFAVAAALRPKKDQKGDR